MSRYILLIAFTVLLSSTATKSLADTAAEIAALVPGELRDVYASHQFLPFWLELGKPSARVDSVLTTLDQAGEDGLNPEDYNTDTLRAERDTLTNQTSSEQQQAHFDIAISLALLRFANDLTFGRIDPKQLGLSLDISARRSYAKNQLTQLFQADSFDAAIEGLRPPMPSYRALSVLLKQYRLLAKHYPTAPEFPTLPDKKLEAGQHWDGCPALAHWLAILNDMSGDSWAIDNTLYEGELVEAVKRFQSRHGLEPDGVIGNQSMQALKVSPVLRVQQIELAMERLRWIDIDTLGTTYLLVNIPQFTLFAFNTAQDPQKPALTIRVVVGKSLKHQTPLLYKQMTHVIFSPYWNVPRSITTKEILPKWRKDPHYVANENMELVDNSGQIYEGETGAMQLQDVASGAYRLRQRPGKKNALGGIKFMFPNDDSIYMHDTPQQLLFAKDRRDFSHGCIRLADPMALALFVLSTQGDWTEQKIQEQIDGGVEKHLKLSQPVPVLVMYLTASVRDDGAGEFFRDIYDQDAELLRALAQR